MPLTRRELLAGLAGATVGPAITSISIPQNNAALRINSERLQKSLEGLSIYGRPAGGTFADGVSRVAYSEADVAGRKYALDLMRAAGLDPRIDTAGNILATREGTDRSLKPILFGSHIDSVPSGGNFDGDVGSMSAIEVIHSLNDHNLTTRHPLMVAIWQNEEGGLVGSRAAFGDALDMDRKYNGIRLGDGFQKIGGDPSRIAEARLPSGFFHCYLELHIEQGGNLDKMGIPIGVVEGIVSIDEYSVEIR
jgi:N-carbamoyl-L-amino-acid hydrolase